MAEWVRALALTGDRDNPVYNSSSSAHSIGRTSLEEEYPVPRHGSRSATASRP